MTTLSYTSPHHPLHRMMNWNWIARDSNGAVYLFSHEPRYFDGTYLSDYEQLYIDDSKILGNPVLQYIGENP